MKKAWVKLVFSVCIILLADATSLIGAPTASCPTQTCTAKCNNGSIVTCSGTISCRAIDGFGCISHNRNIPDYIIECP